MSFVTKRLNIGGSSALKWLMNWLAKIRLAQSFFAYQGVGFFWFARFFYHDMSVSSVG
jgi:hypothetical protein